MPGEREGTERYGQQKRRVCLVWDRAGSKGGVEGPIRLDPDRIDQLGLHGEFAPRRVEDPLAFGLARLIEDRAASRRRQRIKHDLIPPFDVQMVSRGIDDDVGLTRHQLTELFGE